MNKEFIPYKQALELKELGFDEHCFGAYNMQKEFDYCNHDEGWDNASLEILREGTTSTVDVLAPLYQQAFRWFREKHDWPIEAWIQPYLSQDHRRYDATLWTRGEFIELGIFDTYEEAELACLKKLIEIAKTNNMTQQTTHIGDTNKMVTAVEWLELVYHSQQGYLSERDFKEAKQMEKEQRIKDYNAGYVDAQCNHINDAENYANEQEYINDREIKDYTIGPFGTPEKL
jgi:hypothetical protein